MRNPEKTVDRSRFNESRPDIADAIEDDKPHLREPDWDSIEGAAPDTEIVPGDGDTGEGIDKEVSPVSTQMATIRKRTMTIPIRRATRRCRATRKNRPFATSWAG